MCVIAFHLVPEQEARPSGREKKPRRTEAEAAPASPRDAAPASAIPAAKRAQVGE